MKLQFATTEGLDIANHLVAQLGFFESESAFFDLEDEDPNFNIIIDAEKKTFWSVDIKCLNYSMELTNIEEVSFEEVKNWKK